MGRFLARRPFVLLLVPLLVWVTLSPPYHNGPAIRSDGTGYHLWMRAVLTGDFSFCDFLNRADVDVRTAVAEMNPTTSWCANKYPPGVALVQLPFTFPFVDRTSTTYLFSKAEHRACLVCGALAFFATLVLIARTLARLRVRTTVAEAAIVCIAFGGALFHYGTYDAGFSHVYSALELTILLALYVPLTDRPLGLGKDLLALGVTALLVLTRNTNVIPLAWAALAVLSRLGWNVRSTIRIGWPVVVGGALGLALQIAYNSRAAGHLTLSSYGKETFVWSRPMWTAVLWGTNAGLFTYFPIALVLIVAGLSVRRSRMLTFHFACCVLTYAVMYGFWWCWWLGGFGHRGFVEIMPAGALLLGIALQSMGIRTRRLFTIASACAAVYTTQLMLGRWLHDAVHNVMRSRTFWAPFREWNVVSTIATLLFVLLVARSWNAPRTTAGAPS